MAGSTQPTSWPPSQPNGTGGWADGISEDGDTTHVDDLVGWNFVNNTNNPLDDNGHGTHTAGTIGAMGNNGIGCGGRELERDDHAAQVPRRDG